MATDKNVLFLIIDQLRADCVSGGLAEHVDLPNIRALMQDSVSFERHFSVVNPCGPSRASILTGQYAMNHRSVRNGTPLRHDIPNIATQMRRAGYRPMLFGYTDTSPDPRVHDASDPALTSFEEPMTGFDEVVEMRMGLSLPWKGHLAKRGYDVSDPAGIWRPVSASGGKPQLYDPAIYAAEDSDTAFLTDRFLEVMTAHPTPGWFAHLTYLRPHPPLVAPAPYNTMYDADDMPDPVRLDTAADECRLHALIAAVQQRFPIAGMVEGFPGLAPSAENIRSLRALYFGLATEVDHHVGRVLQFLRDSGQYDNTLIVLTADHGEMLGDRHLWGKMSPYDAAFHTPLIIRDPDCRQSAGTQVELPTESIDIAPTILDWIGQVPPNSMDGRSLLPFLRAEPPDNWRNYSYSELDFGEPEKPETLQDLAGISPTEANLCILRDARFTLIEFAADLPAMLFDHHGKGELENVADRPEFHDDLLRMLRNLLRHRMKNMDQTLALTTLTDGGPKSYQRHP